MNRIKLLREEIEVIEKEKSTKMFMQLINNEKFEFLNNQLEIVNKKLEIISILLEDEQEKLFIERIIGKPPVPDNDKQKSRVDMIIKNKENISPTILGLYGTDIDKQILIEENEGEILKIEDIKVNINQYLEEDNDSEYEDEVLKKLESLDINDEQECIDVKPNIPPPVVVNQGQPSSSGSNVINPSQNRNWRINEEEQSNPVRKNIDRRQYHIRRTNDYIPMKYVPYDKEPQALNPTGIYLDLDCVEDWAE